MFSLPTCLLIPSHIAQMRSTSVRAWNILALAALSMGGGRCSALLLQIFQSFSSAYFSSLTPSTPATPNYVFLDDIEISRAYVAIKLWFLIARKSTQGIPEEFDTSGRFENQDSEGENTRKIWNDLWPLFETVLRSLEREGQNTSTLVGIQRYL